MTDIAHYSFIPWFRQGLNSQIIEKDTLGLTNGTALQRANLQVQITVQAENVEGGGNEQTIAKVIQVVGPGDVMNVSNKVLIRVNPAPNVNNYEANNLAYMEFYEEDFLWRFTPASPNEANNKRLRPWLALIVLKNEEYTLKQLPDSLPFVSVKKEIFDAAFHNPAETWAWAHVHFNETLEEKEVEQLKTRVTNELNEDSDSALSRLLCPRKLNKSTAYRAFLIPAFETGRRTGLGLEIADVVAQDAAWTASAGQETRPRGFDFPVYYQWAFQTSNDGDFETLVTKLKPIVMEPESGMMPMDVQELGYGLDQKMAIKTMGMEAALRPPSFENIRKNFPDQLDETVVSEQLKDFLNLSPSISKPADSGSETAKNPWTDAPFSADPMIVPPVYGAWHGQAENLKTGVNFPWLKELNLDFRNRAAAGLGTKVIQKHQEELMNRAWKQVGKVNEANNKINEAFLSKLVNNAIFKKHMLGAKTDKFVRATGAVQHLVWNAAKSATITSEINKSAIPNVTQTAAFQKIIRPTNLTKRLAINNNIISNFNQSNDSPSAVTAAKLKTPPSAALTLQAATQLVSAADAFYQSNALNLAKDTFFSLLNITTIAGNDLNAAKTGLQSALSAQPGLPAEVVTTVTGLINNMQTYSRNAEEEVEVGVGDAQYTAMFDNFSGGRSYANAKVVNMASTKPVAEVTSSKDVQNYKNNLQLFGVRLNAMPAIRVRQPLAESLSSVKTNIIAQLKPDFTLRHRVGHTIKIWDGHIFKPVKELKPVMAYPEFHEPSYEYLEEISQNFILPNVDKLPRNVITLLETNNRFIESFLAGLNHEMARELLWREYPTDQSGSYFRQFWNIKDNIFETDPGKKKDVLPMNEWAKELGFHRPGESKDILVLVVRGDLFKKYPSTMVYAQMAKYATPDASKARKLLDPVSKETTKFPLFKAELKPDITLFGFDLTAEEANGDRITTVNGSTAGKKPGWFFVFKERAGQTQFGLDDYTTETGDTTQMPVGKPATWSDFTWEHLVNQKGDLDNFQLNFSKAMSITDGNAVKEKYLDEVPSWASNSAEVASILYQDPVLIARHAGEMLNEDLLNL
jgi:hypothetical protein